MKTYINGQEINFVEGGYRYIFMKPFGQFQEKTIKKENGDKMHLEFYDNGVQIRTLMTKSEVATIVNREIAIDTASNKIYILEEGNKAKLNPDGSVEVV